MKKRKLIMKSQSLVPMPPLELRGMALPCWVRPDGSAFELQLPRQLAKKWADWELWLSMGTGLTIEKGRVTAADWSTLVAFVKRLTDGDALKTRLVIVYRFFTGAVWRGWSLRAGVYLERSVGATAVGYEPVTVEDRGTHRMLRICQSPDNWASGLTPSEVKRGYEVVPYARDNVRFILTLAEVMNQAQAQARALVKQFTPVAGAVAER